MKRNAIFALKQSGFKIIFAAGFIMLFILILFLISGIISYILDLGIIADGIDSFDDARIFDTSMPDLIHSLSVCAVGFVILFPLWFGFKRMCYKTALGQPVLFGDVFYAFRSRRYLKILRLYIAIGIRRLLWLLLFCLPIAVMWHFILRITGRYIDPETVLLILSAAVLSVICLLLAYCLCLRYHNAPYIMMDNPDYTAAKCLRMSVSYMKGRKGRIFNLTMSFVPLFTLGIFLFPLMLVLPYIQTTSAIYAKYYMNYIME